jgi:hypothetical protein
VIVARRARWWTVAVRVGMLRELLLLLVVAISVLLVFMAVAIRSRTLLGRWRFVVVEARVLRRVG